MEIATPRPEEWAEFRRIRLEALRTDPAAFGSSYAAEASQSDELWQARLAKVHEEAGTQLALVAKRGAEAVGLVGAYRTDETWRIISLFVSPRARGEGIGRALIREVLRAIECAGATRSIELTVNAERKHVVALYEELGFRVESELRGQVMGDGKPHDELVMRYRPSAQA